MSVGIVRDVRALRAAVDGWHREAQVVALVPTMGALHAGHTHLIEQGHSAADRVVATVFVNPRQFSAGEDFAAYPRDLDADLARIGAVGGDLVYAPDAATMYPAGFATTVSMVGPASVGLEDSARPAHFAGVATVVTKLLIQVAPDLALFGEKDFQQLRVIERLVADLDLPVEVRGLPTVRDIDGLALSSRNAYLDAQERRCAPALHAAMVTCRDAISAGALLERSLDKAREALRAAGFSLDYLVIRRADTLEPFSAGQHGDGRLLAAARLGRTRLIDNIAVPLPLPSR